MKKRDPENRTPQDEEEIEQGEQTIGAPSRRNFLKATGVGAMAAIISSCAKEDLTTEDGGDTGQGGQMTSRGGGAGE